MNGTIWKFPVPDSANWTLELPAGAVVLSVGLQKGHYQMWVLVNENAPKETRHFQTMITGGHFDYNISRRFVGTIIDAAENYVIHVFEKL